MVYGDLKEVRSLAGIKQVFVHKQKIGKGDATIVTFRLPNVGHDIGYLLDQSGAQTSTITTDDITVYVTGVSVTITSIDQEGGTVLLAAAPANNAQVTAEYQYSRISDAEVIAAMTIAKPQVDDIIRGSGVAVASYVESLDGNGEDYRFYLEKYDVTSVATVVVNGSTKTADTDYKLYKHRGQTTYIEYVRFLSPPSTDWQNVVITYAHGAQDDLVDHLSDLIASRVLLIGNIPNHKDGKWVDGGNDKSFNRQGSVQLKKVNNMILPLLTVLDRRFRHERS